MDEARLRGPFAFLKTISVHGRHKPAARPAITACFFKGNKPKQMSDQLVGWLQVILGAASLLLTVAGMKRSIRRRRRCIRFSCWKAWGVERSRFEMTDDSQL
jgi:hypothetical protein